MIIYEECSELTEDQIKWLLSRTLKDNPKLSKVVKDFRETDHGEAFDKFELFDKELKDD